MHLFEGKSIIKHCIGNALELETIRIIYLLWDLILKLYEKLSGPLQPSE